MDTCTYTCIPDYIDYRNNLWSFTTWAHILNFTVHLTTNYVNDNHSSVNSKNFRNNLLPQRHLKRPYQKRYIKMSYYSHNECCSYVNNSLWHTAWNCQQSKEQNNVTTGSEDGASYLSILHHPYLQNTQYLREI